MNSRNSSKPPSSDPNRKKESRKKSGRKPGGQNGHKGMTLRQIDKPDAVEIIKVDRRSLAKGQYRITAFEKRQVFDIDISRLVTEYQAEVLEDARGDVLSLPFLKG